MSLSGPRRKLSSYTRPAIRALQLNELRHRTYPGGVARPCILETTVLRVRAIISVVASCSSVCLVC